MAIMILMSETRSREDHSPSMYDSPTPTEAPCSRRLKKRQSCTSIVERSAEPGSPNTRRRPSGSPTSIAPTCTLVSMATMTRIARRSLAEAGRRVAGVGETVMTRTPSVADR